MSARGTCPSCGAAVEFRFEQAYVTTCRHCGTTVSRSDGKLEDCGRHADLVASEAGLEPFRRGRYAGVTFTLMGRTVLQHPKGGRWSEWYAALENGEVGWLSEAQGVFTFMREVELAPDLADRTFEDLAPGTALTLGGERFVVGERQTRRTIASEGEIPFIPVFDHDDRYVDLVAEGGAAATLDFAFDEPTLFLGRVVTLEALGLPVRGGSRDAAVTATEALACGNCGGPIKLVVPGASRRVTCVACGSLHDVEGTRFVLLETLAHAKRPPLGLGSRFRHENTEWQLVGWVERSVTSQGVRYPWNEYVSYAAVKGFRYLVEARGHWLWVTPAPSFARPMPTEAMRELVNEGVTYTLFAHDHATVDAVAGEFPWRVTVGELSEAFDYVSAPHVLSCEGDASEINWSRGEHLERSTVAGFFPNAHLPPAEGVGMVEPNPYEGIGRVWWRTLLASFVLFLALLPLRASREVLAESLVLPSGAVASPTANEGVVLTTSPFELRGSRRVKIDLRADPPLDSYVDFVVDVLDDRDAPVDSVRAASTALRDEDGDPEGKREASVTIGHLPPGSYRLRVDTVASSPLVQQVVVTVSEGGVSFSDFLVWQIFALALLAVFGIFKHFFETKRREASDFNAYGRRLEGAPVGSLAEDGDSASNDDDDSGSDE